MKTIRSLTAIIMLISAILVGPPVKAQMDHMKTQQVKVFGNCNVCKKKIEAAAYSKKVSSAVWNKVSNVAILSYDSTKTTADAILKKIALAGYDNQGYLAPDAAYAKLDQCCQYERKQGNGDMIPHSSHNSTGRLINATDSNPVQQNEQNLSSVYSSYFAVKDALVKGDGKTAAAAASDLIRSVKEVQMDKLPVTQHQVWMRFMNDISYNAGQIKGTTEVNRQRVDFARLSLAMYEVMKAIRPEYPVYYDNCPMYNEGKGADWLSKESVIKNPYYGTQMLSCGNVKETIK